MRSLLFVFAILVGTIAYADESEFAFPRNDGFQAFISKQKCESIYSNFIWIPKPLTKNESFNLFAFSVESFDPRKPSLLFVHGGPGGIWGPEMAAAYKSIFPNHNLVFFHYRGGGCSSFNSLDATLDSKISSELTLNDIESIREKFEIEQWDGIVGLSYGTNVARLYANKLPNRVEKLILEGLELDSSLNEESTSDPSGDIVLAKIEKAIQLNLSPFDLLKNEEIKNFKQLYASFIKDFSPETQYGLASSWDTSKKVFEDYYKNNGLEFPSYLNEQTFLATTALVYSGLNDEGFEYAIIALYSQFTGISLPEFDFAALYLNQLSLYFFPFLHENYLDLLEQGLVSFRVQMAMPENDSIIPKSSYCTTVPVLVVNGKLDAATPVTNINRYLSDKNCTQGASFSIFIEQGGHSSLGEISCLSDYTNKFLQSGSIQPGQFQCSEPVTIRSYQ